MTNDEIRNGLLQRTPVIYKGSYGEVEYLYINAIIYRLVKNKIDISLELMDKCGHSVLIVEPSKCRLKENLSFNVSEQILNKIFN